MKILIQKFGGTSVSNDDIRNKAIDRIIDSIEKGFKPVVVVSAIGRKGDPYATDTLIDFIKSQGIEPDLRELDIIMSCGEIISSVVMANAIKNRGYKAKSFNGGQAGIVTDNTYTDGKILNVDSKRILEAIEEGYIPVVTGFQGLSQNGDITTLGRGGSDVTASILGEALKAEAIEIYTDVDGIMTADPRVVEDACTIDSIVYNEVFQMASYGSKVIHPRAVEVAMRCNIPVVIKNTYKDVKGTIITNDYDVFRYRDDNKVVTSVAQIDDRIQVNVKVDTEKIDVLFSEIANNCISIDMINVYLDESYFIIDGKDKEVLESLLDKLKFSYNFIEDCSKVTIIGTKMRGVPGVMARLINGLRKENISILQTSDSHTTISCLVRHEDSRKTVNLLHREFSLNN